MKDEIYSDEKIVGVPENNSEKKTHWFLIWSDVDDFDIKTIGKIKLKLGEIKGIKNYVFKVEKIENDEIYDHKIVAAITFDKSDYRPMSKFKKLFEDVHILYVIDMPTVRDFCSSTDNIYPDTQPTFYGFREVEVKQLVDGNTTIISKRCKNKKLDKEMRKIEDEIKELDEELKEWEEELPNAKEKAGFKCEYTRKECTKGINSSKEKLIVAKDKLKLLEKELNETTEHKDNGDIGKLFKEIIKEELDKRDKKHQQELDEQEKRYIKELHEQEKRYIEEINNQDERRKTANLGILRKILEKLDERDKEHKIEMNILLEKISEIEVCYRGRYQDPNISERLNKD